MCCHWYTIGECWKHTAGQATSVSRADVSDQVTFHQNWGSKNTNVFKVERKEGVDVIGYTTTHPDGKLGALIIEKDRGQN